ncbi:MAG: DsbA family protein [Acidovorax sp.]|nr:DsbA family protein [Acidovorax sp.]
MPSMPTVTVTYLFDPLCGWCYAAAPALQYLRGVEGVNVELAPTGLFAGAGARPMDAQFAAYAWANDQRIQQLTGQPFTQAYRDQILGAANGRFDSGPATLALTAVAQTAPERELDALHALHALQHARYVDGRDNTDPAVIAEVLRALGLQEAAALALAPDTALQRATAERTATAQAMLRAVGARGVPQLVVTSQGGALRLLGGDALLGPREPLLALVRAAAAA